MEQLLSAYHYKSHNAFTQLYLKEVAWTDLELFHLGLLVAAQQIHHKSIDKSVACHLTKGFQGGSDLSQKSPLPSEEGFSLLYSSYLSYPPKWKSMKSGGAQLSRVPIHRQPTKVTTCFPSETANVSFEFKSKCLISYPPAKQ